MSPSISEDVFAQLVGSYQERDLYLFKVTGAWVAAVRSGRWSGPLRLRFTGGEGAMVELEIQSLDGSDPRAAENDPVLSRTREALHRLAILAEWEVCQPPQQYVPEARDKYDLDRLIDDLLDDELIQQLAVDAKGLGSPWFRNALIGRRA